MTSPGERPVLQVEGIRKNFGGFTALDGVDLDLAAGSAHAVVGPNGAGKTTLLQVLTGVIPPTAGRVWVKGKDVTRWPPWRRIRAGVGRTFQVAHVFDQMTVGQSLRVAGSISHRRHVLAGFRPASGDERAAVEQAAHDCGLRDMLDRVVGELSHGDRKRVELALALVGRPEVLVLDEPTAGMSRGESQHVTALLGHLARQQGVSILLIEHDMDVVGALADTVTALDFGRVIFHGRAEEMAKSDAVRRAYLGQPEASWAATPVSASPLTSTEEELS